MSLSEHIFQVWAASTYTPPTIPLIYNENEYMVTIDDTGAFLRFMSTDGQIYLALNTKCQLGKPDPTIGNSVYVCTKLDPILCSPTTGIVSFRDLFVLNNIVPLLL